MVINPRRIPIAEEELVQQYGEEMKGRAVLAYEGDERRGGSKGRMHRSLVLWGKNGVRTLSIIASSFHLPSAVNGPRYSVARCRSLCFSC